MLTVAIMLLLPLPRRPLAGRRLDYNMMTHVLTARGDLVYVVHTPEDNHFRVQMLDFHDDAGTSGYVTLRWAPLAPPT